MANSGTRQQPANKVAPANEVVLAVNAGSGSVRVVAFGLGGGSSSGPAPERPDASAPERSGSMQLAEPLWTLDVVRHERPQRATVTGAGTTRTFERDDDDPVSCIRHALPMLWQGDTAVVRAAAAVRAVGHRLVHGGPALQDHALVDDALIETLRDAGRFAPLHNPPGLAMLEHLQETLADARHVACLDTVFHAGLPAAARLYAGPAAWADRGFVRYGFHGLAHHHAAVRTATLLGRATAHCSLLSVHLGGGCSASAIENGRPLDTTMGLTPTDGMAMAERSGGVDPGLLIALQREDGLTPDALETLLNHESGLMGLTRGRTGDIARVLDEAAADDGNGDAARARDVYVHRACREIAGVAASLQRIDAITFSGSAIIDSPELRQRLCAGLRVLGVQLDATRNAEAEPDDDIARPGSAVRIHLVAADEARTIAELTLQLTLTAGDRPTGAAQTSTGASRPG